MDGSANERGAQMSTGLQVKVVLAGVAAHALSRLQWWTRGRIGGFDLHHRLWQVYTLDCRVRRTGYVVRDLCPIGLRAAVRELVGTLADVLECGDLRGHLAAWWDVVAGRVDVDGPALVVCIPGGFPRTG